MKKLEGNKRSSVSDSFFAWFSCSSEDATADEMGEMIKDEIWANPLQYFLAPDLDENDESNDEEGDEDGVSSVPLFLYN